jgi:hypothetical protein
MDFARAFSFQFQDPDWIKKIAIIALVSLIPIVGQLVALGWSADVTSRVIQRDPTPLPDLRFGEQLKRGFQAFVVGLVYAIPVILIQLPIIITSSLVSGGSIDYDLATTLVTVVSLCCGSLILLYALFLAVMLPVAITNFIAQNRISAGLRLGEVIGLFRAAPGAWLFVLVGVIVGGFISSLGTILCVVGVIFTSAYVLSVTGSLYGQAYLESVRNQAYR